MVLDGHWLNEPPFAARDGDALTIRTGRETDFWNNTFYGFLHANGHFLGTEAEGDRTLIASFLAGYRDQYDQAGAMLRVDDRTWIKCGIEYTEGAMKVSAVVTRGDQSDWSVRPYRGDPAAPVTLRVTRHGEALRVDVREDGEWHLVRLAFLPMPPVIAWGVMACSPTGEGLEVRFSDVRLGPAIAREMV